MPCNIKKQKTRKYLKLEKQWIFCVFMRKSTPKRVLFEIFPYKYLDIIAS